MNRLLAALPLLLLLASCGESDDQTPSPGPGSQPDADAGGGGDAAVNTTQEYFCDPAGEAACENDTDCPLVENGSAKAKATECGKACLGTPAEDLCTENCIVDQLHTTRGCAGCLDVFFSCLFERCVAPCLTGTPAECTTCSRNEPTPETSCSGGFFVCSGAVLNPDYVTPE